MLKNHTDSGDNIKTKKEHVSNCLETHPIRRDNEKGEIKNSSVKKQLFIN
jgi:hypothetical protein